MTRLPARFIEDRALRDAARAVLIEDIEHLRASLAEEGIASRVSSGVTGTISTRIRTGARDVLAQAMAQANDYKGVLALLVGAIILFLARGPILDWIETLGLDEDVEDNPGEAAPDAEAAGGDDE
ncbi:hypothetical protein CHX26_10645 [Porphyrobacter sp. HT-58-2]|uniref:hypothetical protein n=1 Tax=Porphyrobacter sp. HT-58-2 TaxID=2023229 RepID=UPI000CDC6B24|nr:hypothetical protein [Porphyrobacter sp. HT-58-2]AUX69886.1 hypothetical protein CHX26_10645 [Porphyrobacter sp. HT-58-2]